jgi:hypothetical protein
MKLLVKAEVCIDVAPNEAGSARFEAALNRMANWLSDIARSTSGQSLPDELDYDVGKIAVKEADSSAPALPSMAIMTGSTAGGAATSGVAVTAQPIRRK